MVADVFAEIARKHGIRLLLRFGSTVTGALHPRSDVDLAVLLERHAPSLADLADLLHDLQRCFPDREVDLAILNRAGPLFLTQLTERCRLLHGELREAFLASRIDEVLAARYLERMIGRMIDVNLVHEYDEIDPGHVHAGPQDGVRDMPEYLRRVHTYVAGAG